MLTRMRLSRIVLIAGIFVTSQAVAPAQAQDCPALSIGNCRSTAAEGGAFLHGPNRSGQMIWTTQCGPNTFTASPDTICRDISQCTAAGGFGKFLDAVTGSCESKHFKGYFGLDGMTFGILDWTADNLPALLQAYQQRNPASFGETLGGLGLPMRNGCLDAKWTCESNRKGLLMCDAAFRSAFEKALASADFQKAQATEALEAYERRLKRHASLGLQSEYGNVAMAVVSNNLVNSEACRPATWKAACAGRADEKSMVDCMLDRYVAAACRGSVQASKSRQEAIKELFRRATPGGIVHPPVEDVIACSANWGK